MSERLRDALTVVVIVAVLLLVLWGALALRRGRGAEQRPPTTSGGGVAATRRAVTASAASAPQPQAVTAVDEADAAQPSASAAPESRAAEAEPQAATTAWTRRPPADFTPDDLAQCGRGVRVDVGKYEVAVGSEFDVEIRVASPALESCIVAVQYDKGAVAVVPGSAVPTGPQFRSGIECYAAEASGKLFVLHAGTPGKKNLDASSGGTASVTCRMRALRPGVTRLVVLPETSFTNGRGEEEVYEASGGEVSIR